MMAHADSLMWYKNDGALAQLVEQWTENPCVPSSILGGTTVKKGRMFILPFFLCPIASFGPPKSHPILLFAFRNQKRILANAFDELETNQNR
jgi:hypothetical protein